MFHFISFVLLFFSYWLILFPLFLLSTQNNLRLLNISDNRLDTLSEIGPLSNLVLLIATNNQLDDMKEMNLLLKCWSALTKLELTGNPICLKNKYRERIIVLAPNLELLDGKEIQEMSRQFLQNWKTSKEMQQQQQQQQHQQQQENHQESQLQQQQQQQTPGSLLRNVKSSTSTSTNGKQLKTHPLHQPYHHHHHHHYNNSNQDCSHSPTTFDFANFKPEELLSGQKFEASNYEKVNSMPTYIMPGKLNQLKKKFF